MLKATQFFVRATSGGGGGGGGTSTDNQNKPYFKTGCSRQVCSDEEVITTCEWRTEYECYKTAKCERQSNGKCGFTGKPPNCDDVSDGINARTPLEACPNCATLLIGVHCHACGQKKINPNEFSLKRFIARVVNDFPDLESTKVFKTLVAMFTKPGLLAREYLAGRRGNYIGPVKLYLTFSALIFCLRGARWLAIRGSATDRTARTPMVVNAARKRGVDPAVLADKVHQRPSGTRRRSGFSVC